MLVYFPYCQPWSSILRDVGVVVGVAWTLLLFYAEGDVLGNKLARGLISCVQWSQWSFNLRY